MATLAGLWIDHREAFIVLVGQDTDANLHIESGVEKHVRFTPSNDGSADDQRDRRFASHLALYYDNVIEHIRNSDSFLIMGPGEAKGELQARLENKGLGERVDAVETVDKMTEKQLKARIVNYHKRKREGYL